MKPRQLPSGSWNVRVTIDGHTFSFTHSDKKTVKHIAAAFADEYRENRANPPLCKALEDFITERSESLSPSTIRAYAGILRMINERFPSIARKRIVNLTNRDIQTIIQPLRTPKTQRNYVNLIQVATDRKFRVKYKTTQRKHIIVPTDLEVLGLIEIFRDSEMEVPVLLGAYGGLRRGEIAALTMQDIDGDYVRICKDVVLSDDHEWIVKPPKTESSNRDVLLPHTVADRIRKQGYITHLSPRDISNRFRKKQLSLGIEKPYSFHSLRHYSASYLHSQGIPDAYIMARGGWSSPSVMQSIYRHALSDHAIEMDKKAVSSFPIPFQ